MSTFKFICNPVDILANFKTYTIPYGVYDEQKKDLRIF